MNVSRKIISALLAVLLLCSEFVRLSIAEAQTTGLTHSSQQIVIPTREEANQRLGGTSFGTNPDINKEQNQLNPLNSLNPSGTTSAIQGGAFGTLTYQVHILGEVNRPGTYRVPASTRLSEAVQIAGGILERGSERSIELRREAGGGRKVDLLSFKVLGNLDANPYLLDNDVIYVPLKKRVVEIEGAVMRPGIYELKSEKNIEDLVHLAGGFSSGVGNPTPIKVVRFVDHKKEVIDVENESSARKQFQMENADVVVIPHILTEKNKFDYNVAKLPGDNQLFFPSYEERVFVLGAVAQPGPYSFSPYYNLGQYLTLAGGTTKLAKPKKIRILTAEGKRVKADRNTQINPGDTIVVPEKYMAPETFATLVIGITSSLVAITASVLTLTR
jgi:protein involved in polysaccharide export with SLBB domain